MRKTAINLREILRIVICYIDDFVRYLRYSGVHESAFDKNAREVSINAQATKDYHRIEKGLALASPRRGFGEDVAKRLEIAIDSGILEPTTLDSASTALSSLNQWNHDGVINDQVAPIKGTTMQSNSYSFEEVVGKRTSTRNFDPERTIATGTIESAVSLAAMSPSVCNRRPWRVHSYSDPAQIASILALQNGNRGFEKTIPHLLVVTVETGAFMGANERNQRWIDGGIFASTLVHSIQASGLDSCMLNWSQPEKHSRSLRRVADIACDQDIVLLIAVGYAATGSRRTRSPQISLHSSLRLH